VVSDLIEAMADVSGNSWWEQRRMGGVADRSDVTSGDGGSIVVWVEGVGPPLVLVHGSVSDHTVREARIEEGWDWQPERFARIAVPTLLITGSETPSELVEVTSLTAAAIPGACVHVLAGHGHVAHDSEPGVVAQVLQDWLK
jgi:hypothetical protein